MNIAKILQIQLTSRLNFARNYSLHEHTHLIHVHLH